MPELRGLLLDGPLGSKAAGGLSDLPPLSTNMTVRRYPRMLADSGNCTPTSRSSVVQPIC